MTVTYIQHVLNGGKFGAFLRLLFMWRGSVYKATGINLVIFICLYTLISLLYRYLLSQEEQYKLGRWSVVCSLCSPVILWSLYCSAFEHLCVYLGRSADFIPLGFILGFYVTQVVNRWWGQYNSIVWPDTLALNLISFMPGHQVRQSSLKLTNTNVVIVLENNW